MSLTEDHKKEILVFFEKLFARIEDIAYPSYTLYGDDDTYYSLKFQQIESTIKEHEGFKERLINVISEMDIKISELENKITVLENIIRPDETDVHNINRRIDILGQKIAQLESDSKKRWFK